MVEIPIYQIDAFAGRIFEGNPAAVCPLSEWLSDDLLLKIAAENNLSETAFLVPKGEAFEIRWFTPTVEVDLCGHATLASAFVLLNLMGQDHRREIHFQSRKSGKLSVVKRGELIELDFPVISLKKTTAPQRLLEGLGQSLQECFLSSNDTFVAIFQNESEVAFLKPNLAHLVAAGKCVSVSAPGRNSDFVSRYFAPTHGIDEDPVTGSAFCYLAPYWTTRLKKSELHAFQISSRRGEVFCQQVGDRVKIAGRAALYLQGTIRLP